MHGVFKWLILGPLGWSWTTAHLASCPTANPREKLYPVHREINASGVAYSWRQTCYLSAEWKSERWWMVEWSGVETVKIDVDRSVCLLVTMLLLLLLLLAWHWHTARAWPATATATTLSDERCTSCSVCRRPTSICTSNAATEPLHSPPSHAWQTC